MKGLLSFLRNALVAAIVMSVLGSFSGCSKKEEPKEQAKVEKKQEGQSSATIENLKAAYVSEVKHATWYDLFAKQAQKENLGEVAAMFRALSQSEKVHADNMVKSLNAKGIEATAPTVDAPPAGKTKQYLKLALSSEGVETESMYPAFTKQATSVGDSTTAQMFIQTEKGDLRHAQLLKRAMEQESNFWKLPYMMCANCGYIVGSDKDECPVCKAKKETFKKI